MSGMIIGDRIRGMREEKKPSQGDIEKRTGLLRPPSENRRMTLHGAALVKRRVTLTSFAAC
jgi:hypothetical protein